MGLKLMYITKRPDVAYIAEKSGTDRILVDLEYIGKNLRQKGMDTVQNHHTFEDVRRIRKVVSSAELVVRVNPIHNELDNYPNSKDEIETVIQDGADIIMLPYFKTTAEVKYFLECVDNRVKTLLLLETADAVDVLDEILQLEGIDEIHIGLNDLSISYGKKFLFEPLIDGTVERLCQKLKTMGKVYGFGGIASIGKGLIPAEMIIKEHYRLESSMAILSRSFCEANKINDIGVVEEVFYRGIREIRALEKECEYHMNYFTENERAIKQVVKNIVSAM